MRFDQPTVPDPLGRLERCERPIRDGERPPNGAAPFRHDPGTASVLATALHDRSILRQGRIKREEEYTSGLAGLLAEGTDTDALDMTRRVHAFQSDRDGAGPGDDGLSVCANRRTASVNASGCSNRQRWPARSINVRDAG